MKNALITGAEGFIGSHLTELLLKQNFKVTALVHYNSFNSYAWLEEFKYNKNLQIILGDVRDLSFCKEITKNVDVIFHLAALIGIPYSYLAPESYIDTNVKGTLNICQSAMENGNIRIVQTSTSEVYGTSIYVPMDEKHPLQPQSPYSASKIASDSIAMSFYHSFNLPLTILRPFNTYGPRQSARAVIPSIIVQILNNIKEISLGETSTTRDFNYVKDTCSAFVAVYENDETIGQVINAGSNSEISIHELFHLIKRIMNSKVDYISKTERIRPVNSEVQRLYSDSRLLEKLTGFKRKFDLRNGLEETIKWFSKPENLKHYKANIYNV